MNSAYVVSGLIASCFAILLGFGAVVRAIWTAANAFERLVDRVESLDRRLEVVESVRRSS